MQSLKELYKVGKGPSSSHTLAPERACLLFTKVFGTFPYYEAELFGSLSLTGKGHATDAVIENTLPGETKIIFSLETKEEFPNGFYIRAYDTNHELQHSWTVFSLGGGSIQIKEYHLDWDSEVYKENSYKEISEVLSRKNISLLDYIYAYEPELKEHLKMIVRAELDCVEKGLNTEGLLPGKLNLLRSAKELYESSLNTSSVEESRRLKMMAYAYAASEENGAGHTCVTAPTLGACGVIASMVNYYIRDCHFSMDKVSDALAVGGIFGNLIKQNASISGATAGCQAEIGAAVSMASASICYLENQDLKAIEYAAEIGMEHNLGLTCDPVMGYVLIPCIERNAMGILRSYDAALLSKHMSNIKEHLVSFDMVVKTMKETGSQIPITLKETSQGGLAKEFFNE